VLRKAVFGRSPEVGEQIAAVAVAADDPVTFSARARAVAETFGPAVVAASKRFLFAPPDKPALLAGRHEGVGDWMWVCQAAVFEIWFHVGADALRELRAFAFGTYDWTQAHAARAVCRLAVRGVDREGAGELIAEALPDWRHEQVMRVCDEVAALAARSAVLRKAYDALTDRYLRGDPVDGFELVAADARADPAHARQRYLPFLHGLMAGKGLEGRTAFDDGHVVATPDGRGVVAKSGREYPQIGDYHQIRAALLLRDLAPEDRTVQARLEAWAAGHPDGGVRTQLRGLLAQPVSRT
jgi:hypothetical protein